MIHANSGRVVSRVPAFIHHSLAVILIAMFLIALFLIAMFANIASVAAHALPDSVLVFSEQNNKLALSIKIPTEDLVIANGTLAPLSELSANDKISTPLKAQISDYVAQHLKLQNNGAKLPLTVEGVSVESAHHEDVGTYTLLSLSLYAPIRRTELVDLTLHYDAVMHEVRNHRAMVYWQQPDNKPIFLTAFGYRRVDGQPKPVELKLP